MKELPIMLDYETQDFGTLVWRELLYGILVGVSEGVLIYLVMSTFGMFNAIAIYG